MTTKIFCPRCGFEPPPNLHWICRPGCGYKWNTFATHGICPGCKKRWTDTKCPACKCWSPHDDWYHDAPPLKVNEIEKIREVETEIDKPF